jgi:hypothetical protein
LEHRHHLPFLVTREVESCVAFNSAHYCALGKWSPYIGALAREASGAHDLIDEAQSTDCCCLVLTRMSSFGAVCFP